MWYAGYGGTLYVETSMLRHGIMLSQAFERDTKLEDLFEEGFNK